MQKLEQKMIDAAKKLHITKNDNVYHDIHNWVLGLSNGIFRPVSCRHNGRHSRNINNTNKYLSLLQEMNIKYETGNDAPRGGECGNYIKITSLADKDWMAICGKIDNIETSKGKDFLTRFAVHIGDKVYTIKDRYVFYQKDIMLVKTKQLFAKIIVMNEMQPSDTL